MHRLILLFVFLSLAACSKDEPPIDDYDPARDYFTFAATPPPEEIESTYVALWDAGQRAVLGAVLLDPGSLLHIIEKLRQDEFYLESHRIVYEACLELHEKGDAADLVTVRNHLTEQGRLEQRGELLRQVLALLEGRADPVQLAGYCGKGDTEQQIEWLAGLLLDLVDPEALEPLVDQGPTWSAHLTTLWELLALWVGTILVLWIAYEKLLLEATPDLVVVVGDVNSTVACTLAAVKLGIMTAHLEAGLRSINPAPGLIRTVPKPVLGAIRIGQKLLNS